MGEGQSMDGLEGELPEAGPVSFPCPFLILPPFKCLLFFLLESRNMECERKDVQSEKRIHHLMGRLYD